jgi:hypothetical protein
VARSAGISCMHPPYPCRKARRSRKGGGSVAWWEKARGSEATKRDRVSIRCAWRKLDCLNLSPHGVSYLDAERWLVTAYWEVAYDLPVVRKDGMRHCYWVSCSSLPSVPPIGGLKGRTRRLNTLHLCHIVTAGSPTQVMSIKPTPAWRRSLHITQGGPVMGSAASLTDWTDMGISGW